MEYDLRESEGESFVFISDMNGKKMDRFHLYDKQNQQVVSTESFPLGIYIVQLFINNELIETHKVQVIK